MGRYTTRKWGPGKCRNGHDKDYDGECTVCVAEREKRRSQRRKEARRRSSVALQQVEDDVRAMRQRVAERRAREQARRRLLAG